MVDPRLKSLIVERESSKLQTYMTQVYGWMTCGLLLTAGVAWYAAQSPALQDVLLTNKIVFFVLFLIQIGVVLVLSGLVNKLSGTQATSLFMFYSLLTGLTISSIFALYTTVSIASTFLVSAAMFGVISLYGYTTKRDLSGLGSMLFMGLIGLVLASLVNMWLKSPALMWVITYIGVIVFVGLTAYDTQKLKRLGEQLPTEDKEQLRRYSILGALTLYLDFINLFLMLLRIFGSRR